MVRMSAPSWLSARAMHELIRRPSTRTLQGWLISEMTDQFAETVRKPRADAVRNRERVLESAKAVFSAGGPDASLEAVAKRAGVGIGTLYRHFPTREALFEAVYRREVEH